MRVPVGALAEMLGELPSVDEIVATLDGLGLPVDAVLELPGAPRGVLVADLIDVRPHPDADGLTVVRVRAGEREAEVVCGAPNARVGLRSAWVPPGTTLPALGQTIEAREVRGVRSEGMLASPRELGLFDHQGGLLVLGDDARAGSELADAWGPETVLELEITPNRADATGLLGVARDLAAKLLLSLRDPSRSETLDLGDPDVFDGLHVEVADPERCPRFTLRRIEGVRVGPSPVWLQRRVAAFGLRPRNNVVDVTNLVTFELGQPSHAYDVRALTGGVLQVRRARAEERLRTLGDDELALDPDDLVIATPERAADAAPGRLAAAAGSRAVGLAGVIGGAGDSVRDDTSDVALEVAHFDPVGVRRTARRHKLHTDAHYRFERGVDPALPERASARIAALLAEVAGGTPHTGVTVVGTVRAAPAIDFRPSRVAWLTTLEVSADTQRAMLERLGCHVTIVGDDAWSVAPPSWRVDLGIEEDLIEEVARLHGFEHIAATVPNLAFVPPAGDPTHRALRDALVENGFLETISYAFTGAAELAAARAPAASVVLTEPQGVERAVLRTALYPGLLAAARLNHAERDLALFEVGRVFGAEERERVALLLRGRRLVAPWRAGLEVDFFVAKGVLEQLAERFGAALELRPAAADHLHPHAAAEVLWDGRAVGQLGRVHPEVAAAFELGETFVAELELPLAVHAPALTPLPRQPFAERDLAVIVPQGVTFAELRGALAAVAGPWLISLEPFDVYEGEQVGEGRRSLALRFRFRHAERSLADAEVEACMKEVMQAARAAGYTLRT